jgi:hypothetical protein
MKPYYELLAVEFVKREQKFDFKNKARVLMWFALSDIDSSYIFKTVNRICMSYVEALSSESLSEIPPGLYTDT